VLKIVSIFDGEVIAEIDRDFYSATLGAESLIFLSDKEIYADYRSGISIYADDDFDVDIKNNREIICFRNADNPISFVVCY